VCSTYSVEDTGQREGGSEGCSLLVRGSLNLQMSEKFILVRLLQMYFPKNWEFVSPLSKHRSFGGERF
jgi:hypothetical protein